MGETIDWHAIMGPPGRADRQDKLRSCLRSFWAHKEWRSTIKPKACLQAVDIDGLSEAAATLAATGSLSSGALEAAAGQAERLGSVLEQAGRGGQLVLVQEQLQWTPEMVHDAVAQLSG